MTTTVSSRHVRCMVDLLEAQAQEIRALQRSVRALEGRLEMVCQLDTMIAGQLREPLHVIEDTLDALSGKKGRLQWRQAVDEALSQVRALAGVVNELDKPQQIGPALVERGRLVTVPLDGLVEQALTMACHTLDRGRVEVDLPPGFMITTAPRRLVGILVSLFENAATCDSTGLIECRCEVSDGWLRIEVADRGPALADLDVDSLWELGSGPEEGFVGGRSAGMYLVRMLARSLGGDAVMADRPGGGAVAWVQLPQRRQGDVRSASSGQPAQGPQRHR